MQYNHAGLLWIVMIVIIITSCTQKIEPVSYISLQELTAPKMGISGESNLVVGDDDRVYLTWIEHMDEKNHALKYAVHEASGWTHPQTIVEGRNWFVNWADFPSFVVSEDGAFAAHWLVRSADHSYAYDVNIAQSLDAGRSWSIPISPHDDGTLTEHGFVSMVPWKDSQLMVIWLDGRNFATGDSEKPEASSHSMTLRAAFVNRDGNIHDGTQLDPRVCDCCQTTAVRTSYGAIVAYRDRSDTEIRDISVVRWMDGQWSMPQPVSNDGWKINACPVNGPAISADGKSIALAWFTSAHDQSQVKVSFSQDEGRTFEKSIIVDDGDPMGRVDVVMLPDGAALVSWMESIGDQTELRVRRVWIDGSTDSSIKIASMSQNRRSGFPRMAQKGNDIFFSWTHVDSTTIIKTAVATYVRE